MLRMLAFRMAVASCIFRSRKTAKHRLRATHRSAEEALCPEPQVLSPKLQKHSAELSVASQGADRNLVLGSVPDEPALVSCLVRRPVVQG